MQYLKLLLIGFLFINCANKAPELEKPEEPKLIYTYEISRELQPYVFEYMNTLEEFGIEFKKQSFIVVFDADIMGSNLLGQAKGMFNDNLIYVKINPKLWNQLTVKQRKHVIFHELSHDIFNIEHTEKIKLMNDSMLSPQDSFAMNIQQEIINLMMYIRNEQS
tara:strand:+ start:72 stop:560 length:489 start_codon:yes stop_codon:yes gene_type:complete